MKTKKYLPEKIAIRLPIIQAPMAGGLTTPELVAAVSNAGGLGSLGAVYMEPEEIRAAIRKIRLLTDKSFAVNLFVPVSYQIEPVKIQNMVHIIQNLVASEQFKIPDMQAPYIPNFDAQFKVVIEEKIPVFSYIFGIIDDVYAKELKLNHTKIIGTATTLVEAKALEIAGVDFIVAQGCEAGGHRGTFLGKPENALNRVMSLVSG